MFRTNVDEMHVEPIDLGDELRQGIQFGLALAPIVIRRPITREFLKGSELYALRFISDCLPVGHRVAFMRLRSSVSSASGTST
jgi:hypothetical protein